MKMWVRVLFSMGIGDWFLVTKKMPIKVHESVSVVSYDGSPLIGYGYGLGSGWGEW